MRAKVTEHGTLIPKSLVEGRDEVEILKEQDVIVVVPVAADGPIRGLGKQPITLEVDDASVNMTATSSSVFDEVVTLFNSGDHHAKAIQVGINLLRSLSVELIHVDEGLFDEGRTYLQQP